MTKNTTVFLTRCSKCDASTSKQYARKHGGLCKACATGTPHSESAAEIRNRMIIDHGYDAYAREEGHYDIPDCY